VDFTYRFPAIAQAVRGLSADSALILARLMGNDTGHGARFSVSQVNDGPGLSLMMPRRNR
jgi:hypothetical protein